MFGIRLLIESSRLLRDHIAYEIDTSKIIAAFIRISYCLHDLIRFSSIVCRVQTTRWYMMRIRWSIPLSIGYVWNYSVDMAISTPSCTYSIWNRYWQNHRSILPNLLLFPWFDTPELNRLPCPNNKMYDDAVFAHRFRYQLTMFGIQLFIWLSRLLHAHIAYEIDADKIIAAFFRISYCLHDLIRLNWIVCHDQTTRCTMMCFSHIDSDIIWLCLKSVYW